MSRLLDLDGYITGELPDGAAADTLEEAMFDAPDDADLQFLDRLARHGRQLVADNTFYMGVTRRELDEMISQGHDIAVVVLHPGENRSTFPHAAKLICTQVHLPRSDVERVDVEITLVEQGESKTIVDVKVDNGVVYGLCERPLAQMAFAAGRSHTKIRRRGTGDVIAELYFTPL